MNNPYQNIYKTARESKGLTQEKAAELLMVSVESVRAYESGKTAVSNEMAAEMTTVYENSRLAYLHLRKNPAGQLVLPELKGNDNFSASILSVIKEISDVISYQGDLIEIGADGVVDENEKLLFNKISNELSELQTAISNLKYSKKD